MTRDVVTGVVRPRAVLSRLLHKTRFPAPLSAACEVLFLVLVCLALEVLREYGAGLLPRSYVFFIFHLLPLLLLHFDDFFLDFMND